MLAMHRATNIQVGHTPREKDKIRDCMDNCLDGSYPSDMPVEDVERGKIPTSSPGANVVTTGKEP
jgi:hypothetical protein